MGSGLCLYRLTYTTRRQHGIWESSDDLTVTGYGQPEEFTQYVVAPSPELAEFDFIQRNRYADKARETTFKSVTHVESNIRIIRTE